MARRIAPLPSFMGRTNRQQFVPGPLSGTQFAASSGRAKTKQLKTIGGKTRAVNPAENLFLGIGESNIDKNSVNQKSRVSTHEKRLCNKFSLG